MNASDGNDSEQALTIDRSVPRFYSHNLNKMNGEIINVEQQDPPERISVQRAAVGFRSGFPPLGIFLFGLPFFLIGGYFILGVAGVFPLDMSRSSVPAWVLGLVGVVFLSGGLLVWGMGIRTLRFQRRLALSGRTHQEEPACADYPWDLNGFTPDRWKPIGQTLFTGIILGALMGVGNYVVFFDDNNAPVFAKVIVGLFNTILLFLLYRLVKQILHAVKFGDSRLLFESFPVRRGALYTARIELPATARRAQSGKIELRQLNEQWHVRGRGKNQSKQLVHTCDWKGGRDLTSAELNENPGILTASFWIPDEAPTTKIDTDKPVFWELEVQLKLPGLDFRQEYLVPVY
jgi:hypothetical protein